MITEPKKEWLSKSKPYCSKILTDIPYLRKKISISLVFSAAILLMLSASPLVLFNLVPVQAQTNLSFRTPTPVDGTSPTGEQYVNV